MMNPPALEALSNILKCACERDCAKRQCIAAASDTNCLAQLHVKSARALLAKTNDT